MDMNLGTLARLGFIERRGDALLEGPLLDLMMDTDLLKERIINGALGEVFGRLPGRPPEPDGALFADDGSVSGAVSNPSDTGN
jgi:hypothetical protein